MSSLSVEVSRKRLEFMREVRPGANRFAVAINPRSPTSESQLKNLQAAAASLGVELIVLKGSTEQDFSGMFTATGEAGGGGLVFSSDPYFAYRSQQLAELAICHQVPAITQSRDFPLAGGLMSYGGDFSQSHRQSGRHAGRVLKGEKPSDLPVMQPTRFELFINLKAAGALGLSFPASLLTSADRHRMTQGPSLAPARHCSGSTSHDLRGGRRTAADRRRQRSLAGLPRSAGRLNDLLNAEARLAAKDRGFRGPLQPAHLQLPWSEESGERHRLDALRLLRQVPAVESLSLVDADGRERLFVSRIGLNRIDGSADHSAKPAVSGARSDGVWFGPVSFHDGSEPFMSIAVAGNRSSVGVAVAEINLKFIWDVISGIQVGRTGDALVLDRPGRLVAHPDINLVLRPDEAAQRPFQTLRAAILARPGEAETGRDIAGTR